MTKPFVQQGTRSGRLDSGPVSQNQSNVAKVPNMELESAGHLEEVDDDSADEETAEEVKGFSSLLAALEAVADGGGMQESREILRALMPEDREGAVQLSDKMRRLAMTTEQLRNYAMELCSQRA